MNTQLLKKMHDNVSWRKDSNIQISCPADSSTSNIIAKNLLMSIVCIWWSQVTHNDKVDELNFNSDF